MTDQLASQGAWAAIAPWATGLALALSLVATFAAWTVAAATTLRTKSKWSAWGKHIMVANCSSSIGSALAKHYAAQGAHLWLVADSPESLDFLRNACLSLGAPSVTVVTADPWSTSGWAAVRDALKHGGLQLPPDSERNITPQLKSAFTPSAPKSMSVPPRTTSMSRSNYPKAPVPMPATVPATPARPMHSSKRLAPTPPSTPPPLRRSSRAAFTPQPVVKPVVKPLPPMHTPSSVSSVSSLRSSLRSSFGSSSSSASPAPQSHVPTPDSKTRRIKHGSCSDESIGPGSLDLLVLVTETPQGLPHNVQSELMASQQLLQVHYLGAVGMYEATKKFLHRSAGGVRLLVLTPDMKSISTSNRSDSGSSSYSSGCAHSSALASALAARKEYFISLGQQLAEKHQSQRSSRFGEDISPPMSHERLEIEEARSSLKRRPSLESSARTHRVPVITLAEYEWIDLLRSSNGSRETSETNVNLGFHDSSDTSTNNERSLNSLASAAANGHESGRSHVQCSLGRQFSWHSCMEAMKRCLRTQTTGGNPSHATSRRSGEAGAYYSDHRALKCD